MFDVSFSSDSQLLVSASEDCTARVWQLQDLRQTALLSGHSAEVLRVAWKAGSRVVATGMACQLNDPAGVCHARFRVLKRGYTVML